MRGAKVRYIAVAGCEGREDEALAEVERNLNWLLGALGEHEVRLGFTRLGDLCVARVEMRHGRLLDAVIFSISLSRVGGTYLRPIRSSGTMRGLLERLKAMGCPARLGDEGKPSQSDE
ncbi:MAG: hypothetical protein ACP5NG_03025 [Conexivisphaera sp.]